MNLKKSVIRVMIIGAIAAVVAAHNQQTHIDWSSQCTKDTVVTKWSDIRNSLAIKLPRSVVDIGYGNYQKVVALLGRSFSLPRQPDSDKFNQLFSIVGADVMEDYIGSIFTSYWRQHPCPVYPATSDVYQATTETNWYEATTETNWYEATTETDNYEATTTDNDNYEATTETDDYDVTTVTNCETTETD
ncbi:hypothetical protein H4217_004776, partial [Coemansia sp. RSA 1939]